MSRVLYATAPATATNGLANTHPSQRVTITGSGCVVYRHNNMTAPLP